MLGKDLSPEKCAIIMKQVEHIEKLVLDWGSELGSIIKDTEMREQNNRYIAAEEKYIKTLMEEDAPLSTVECVPQRKFKRRIAVQNIDLSVLPGTMDHCKEHIGSWY